MEKYSFLVMSKESKSPLLDSVVIEVEAEGWGRVIAHEEYTGLPINIMFLRDDLEDATNGRGHSFDLDRHSSCDLYSALLEKGYQVRVEGFNPDDYVDDSLPPGAVD